MSLVTNTNVTSLLAQRQLGVHSDNLRRSMERLASGYRINRTGDDAAGYTISQNMASQIRRMEQASRNTQDGISMLQVAEGALITINENLQRIRELAVQAANDTYNTAMRGSISNEIQHLLQDNDRITSSTQFNGIHLLDGSLVAAPVQVGITGDITVSVVDIAPVLTSAQSDALGVLGGAAGFATNSAVALTTNTVAALFLNDVDTALRNVNLRRANIGSYQSKLESAINNLDISIENFSQANSRIRDVDIAAESAVLAQSQVLTQAAAIVLNQTNDLPQMILQLLQK